MRFRYDSTMADQFRETLHITLDACEQGDLSAPELARQLQDCILTAAQSAHSLLPISSKRTFPRNCWFDEICKSMRKKLRTALSDHTSEFAYRLQKKYKSLTRRKKKQYQLTQSHKMCALAKEDPRAFWQAFKATRQKALNAITPEEWSAAFQDLFNPAHLRAPAALPNKD